ncbi:divalent metal cation transporter, partial [Pseudomonas sp. SIMBA_065]
FVSINAIKALYWSAVINGVVAVPVMAVMMLIVSRADIMGRSAARGWLRGLGWVATGVMLAIALAMLATSF